MKHYAVIGLMMGSLWMTGCATPSGNHAQETEALKNQVASLEMQVSDLNQRIEEMSPDSSSSKDFSGRPGRALSKTRAVSNTLSTRQVQTALKTAGFYDGPVDGQWGRKTKKLVKAFQRAKGLTPDGRVGSQTAAALAKYLNAPSEKKSNA